MTSAYVAPYLGVDVCTEYHHVHARGGSGPPNRELSVPAVHGWVRSVALYLYYLAVIITLLLIYGRGDFTTAPFVYQGF